MGKNKVILSPLFFIRGFSCFSCSIPEMLLQESQRISGLVILEVLGFLLRFSDLCFENHCLGLCFF